MSRQIHITGSRIKLQGNLNRGNRANTCWQTDGRTGMRKVTDTFGNYASSNGSDRNVARSSTNSIFFACVTVSSRVPFVRMLNCLQRLEDVKRTDGWASRTHYLLRLYLWTGINYKELLTYSRHPLQRALDGTQARYCLISGKRSSCYVRKSCPDYPPTYVFS